jgi:putative nucleotidyltransferase with HDIG domain
VIGTHIGNYRIVTELGAGAMGEVYFAEHSVMGRRAAIKVIREELSSNSEMVQRFINEARLVNRIGHPNIVEITDFGEIGSRYYIIMEMLEGETLEERLERVGSLNEATTLHIAIQIVDALRAAHELGVVHRDLKPENIYLINKTGQNDVVKVLDFGIAKLMQTTINRSAAATIPGAILGTPDYMSPEQCHGDEQLDHRSDVYSLGVMLYRMLTGSLPFHGDTVMEIMLAQINNLPVAPRLLHPELSTHTEAIILKALEKLPDDRFPDMLSLRLALEGKAPASAKLVAAAQPTAAANARAASSDRTSNGKQAAADQTPNSHAAASSNQVSNGHRAATSNQAPNGKQAAAAGQAATQIAIAPAQTADEELDQSKRVGSRLARILVDRIHKNKLILPNMPIAARECINLLNDPHQGMTKVAALIGRDPIIAPQVLRRAKSALLGGSANRVRTIDQAVARIGARQLRALLIDLSAHALFESRNPAIRKATRNLWEHSVAVAVLSRALARRRRDVDPEVAYLAGLLHDVGKPVAAALLLDVERSADVAPEAWLGSSAWLGVIDECHREVGVALARSWDLPEEIMLAIARSARYSAEGPDSATSIVCLANALAKRAGIYAGEVDLALVDAQITEGKVLFKLDDSMLETLLTELREQDGQTAATQHE